jgi:Ni,Fe-hydrogenase maturation factor
MVTLQPNITKPISEDTTLIIGLGNPSLGDDGIGWVIADLLKNTLYNRSDLELARGIKLDGTFDWI